MDERHTGSDGKSGVRDTTDDIKLGLGETTPHGFRNAVQNIGVRDNDTKINVDGGDETTLQFELAEFDGL